MHDDLGVSTLTNRIIPPKRYLLVSRTLRGLAEGWKRDSVSQWGNSSSSWFLLLALSLSVCLCLFLSLSVCHSELLFLPAPETTAAVVDESCTYGVG